ncbi:MAG: ABC transporter ATP-binding protein/permease [Clostridiales bacterium]|jgi:ABC-type bacteriocin/lantibiotic exporter with double-glycine peptidase domain|nr:ABC transporter ATP-binding protein/permease [Clostridiales bacterium]
MKERIIFLKTMGRYIKLLKKPIMIMTVFCLLTIPISLISPRFFQIFIDDVVKSFEFEKFKIVAMGMVSVYILRFITDAVILYMSNKLQNKFSYYLRRDIWKKYLNTGFRNFEKYEKSDLKMRVCDDVTALSGFVKNQVVDYSVGILITLSAFCIVLYTDWTMTLCCTAILPLVFLLNIWLGKKIKKINEKLRVVNQEYYSFEYDALQHWKDVKSLTLEEPFINRFKEYRKRLAELGVKNIRCWFFNEIINDFKANYISKVLIYIIGAFFVIKGRMSIGVMFMFSEYFGMMFNNIDMLNMRNVELRTLIPFFRKIEQVLSLETEKKGTVEITDIQNIRADNLKFGYTESREPVLENLGFKVRKGEHCKITGRSGSGKSTLVKLLTGLYEPDRGKVMINMTDLSEIKKSVYYSLTGVVMQDPQFFNMSVLENLIFVRSGISFEEITEVCNEVGILDYINKLPAGFDTVVGEKGSRFSGGQKQRLAIARALLKKPKLLILDEATSSLDNLSEREIYKVLQKISKEITIITISHRKVDFLNEYGKEVSVGIKQVL